MKKKIMIELDEEIFNDFNPFLIDQGLDLQQVIERYVKKLYVVKKEEIDLWNKKELEKFLE